MDPSIFKLNFLSESRIPPPSTKLPLNSSELKNTSLVSSTIQRLYLNNIQVKKKGLPTIESPPYNNKVNDDGKQTS
jgi:hypothetical protein